LEPVLQLRIAERGVRSADLKNELALPAVLDPRAGHVLYEAANPAKNQPGSKAWLVELGTKTSLQPVMMTAARRAPDPLPAI
jgi:electron transfer flavoprotein beta subunit